MGDGVADVLEELRNVYSDTTFQKQLAKLARDVRWDKAQFIENMRRLALGVQAPILEQWAFESTADGVMELQLAIQDHTSAVAREGRDRTLKEKADAVTRLLYGEMYSSIFGDFLQGPQGAYSFPTS